MLFGYCSLTSLTIPGSVTSIGDDAFTCCEELKDVYIYATTPPTGAKHFDTGGWMGYMYKVPNLYVPAGCEKIYFSEGWSNSFKNIIEME